MVTAISKEPSASQVIFGLLCAGKGIGNILTSPISASLLSASRSSSSYGHGMYQAVVIFTGVYLIMSAGALSAMYIRLKK